MRRLSEWLTLGLFCLGMVGSPAAWAELCSQVFPANATPSGVVLDLASIMDGQTYVDFPNSGAHFSTPGSWFYNNGTLGTWDNITVKAGATTWLFFDGDLTFQPQSSINPYAPALNSGGNPEDLIIIVRGNLTIGTKNDINALIYATGNVSMQPQSSVVGAITAQGTITQGSNTSITYDPAAAATFDLPGACSDGTTPVVHHYQLAYASQALTCRSQTVTVTACADAACSTTYTGGASSLTLSPGGSAFSFTGSGSTTVAIRTAQTVNLAVSGASPAPGNSTQCRIDGGAATTGCSLTFADAGLLVQAPDLIAGRADTLTVAAVRKSDNSLQCVPAFASVSRPVQFWSTYLDPDAATHVGSNTVAIDGTAISASPTTLTLNFNASGQASASMSYADAGQMQLDARYLGSAANGDSGLTMTGSDSFVSRPYGLCLLTAAEQSNDYSATSSLFPGDIRAGDTFDLTIKPVVWTAASAAEPPLLAGNICGNAVTLNYMQSDIILSSTELNGGNSGELGLVNHHHRDLTDPGVPPPGGTMVVDQSISEVGVFQLTATPPDYLGVDMSDAVSQSGRVGRFIPASFLLEDPVVTPECGSFTYAGLVGKGGPPAQLGKEGQPFAVEGVLSARNSAGGLTRNYKGSFAKLMADGLAYVDDGNGLNLITAGSSTVEVTAGMEDGYLKYSTSDLRFHFDTPAAPYRLATRVTATDSDGVGGAVVDVVVDAGGAPDPSLLPEFRLGLARVGNAHGSELQNLELPFAAAYFDGSNYVPNPFDNCTVFVPASLGAYQRAGGGSGEPSLKDEPYEAAAGSGLYVLIAPGEGNAGSVHLTYDGVPQWLQFDWDGDGALDRPRGLATFGIYRGPTPLIFRREVYR